jgi:hypothetical protein
MPSHFDSDYAYALGATSVILAATEHSGYMAIASGLSKPVEEWCVGGAPLVAMMEVPPQLPHDHCRPQPCIIPRRADLDGAAFRKWKEISDECGQNEMYENPGPLQLSGPCAGRLSATIATRFGYLDELALLKNRISTIANKCRPGCDPRKVRVAAQSLTTLNSILDELEGPLVGARGGF